MIRRIMSIGDMEDIGGCHDNVGFVVWFLGAGISTESRSMVLGIWEI